MDFAQCYIDAVDEVRMQAQAIPDTRASTALEFIERRDYRAAAKLIKQLDPRLRATLHEAAFYHVACTLYENLDRASHSEEGEEGCARS